MVRMIASSCSRRCQYRFLLGHRMATQALLQTATGHLLEIGVQRQAVRSLIARQEHAVKG